MLGVNPWLILALFIALGSAGGFGFRLGMDHEIARHQKELVAQMEQRAQAEKQINTVSQGYEQVVAWQNQQIKQAQKGWRDALNNPRYIGCDIGAVGVRSLHPGQPDPTVPGNPAAIAKRNDERPDASTLGLGNGLRNLPGTAPRIDTSH